MSDIEEAKDKVMMGAEDQWLCLKMKKLTCEGGHAIVALNVQSEDPIHKQL